MQFHSSFLPSKWEPPAGCYRLSHITGAWEIFLNVAAASQTARKPLAWVDTYKYVSVFLIFHKELSWPSVGTYFNFSSPSSVNIHAGSNSYIKSSNSPRMHKEFLFSKQKRFNCTPIYKYYTAESITRDCIKVVR